MKKELYYGDNLDILRNKIPDETVDLCYIDPPFNSKKDYNLIYNNQTNKEDKSIDKAQSKAFTDTWEWGDRTDEELKYLMDIKNVNERKITEQTQLLIDGLIKVLGKGDLMAYLVSMAVRVVEIHRVLKPTGSFYLHCDPTASHYLKLILDSIFCPNGGNFINEIIWHYEKWTAKSNKLQENHDVIFAYNKSKDFIFNVIKHITPNLKKKYEKGYLIGGGGSLKGDGKKGLVVYEKTNPEVIEKINSGKYNVHYAGMDGKPVSDVWSIPIINPMAKERLGLMTQKPEALMERVIQASSNEGDVVLDAFAGCGTTIAVAEKLKRQWIGIDISYLQIALISKRLHDSCADDSQRNDLTEQLKLDGVPKDMESAIALAHKKDDRLRKEFEKWAVLTYANNQAVVNDKKGADGGIDGYVLFIKNENKENGKAVFQVKSGKVERKDIAAFNSDRQSFGAEIGFFITLEDPTSEMIKAVREAGKFDYELFANRSFNKIEIITIEELLAGKRIELPLRTDVLSSAEAADKNQISFDI